MDTDSGPVVACTMCAPLANFSYEGDSLSIGNGYSIDRITDTERDRLATWGASSDETTHAIHSTRYMTADMTSDEWEAVRHPHPGWVKRAVTTALHLHKTGCLTVPWVIEFAEDGRPTFMMGTPVIDVWRSAIDYSFTADDIEPFARLWRECSPGFADDRLSLSLYRFAKGCETAAADSLIDLMIAAEALFLKESGFELNYRMALRMAFFLEDTPRERMTVFETAKNAYNLRSKMVHGQVGAGRKRSPRGAVTTIKAFEHLMRIALRRASTHVQNESWPPEWEDFIFSDGHFGATPVPEKR